MLQIGFTSLTAAQQAVSPTLFNRAMAYIDKAFHAIEQAAGAPGGLATLDSDGHVPADQLGDVVTPATLHVTATAAANTAVTATLPPVGGKSHFITAIQLVRVSTGAAVAAAAQLVHTSTNLPGNPAWTAGNLLAAGGTVTDLDYQPASPLRSAAPGVATTIVMPAGGAAAVNRINVSYYTA